jgi:hypothetical protein
MHSTPSALVVTVSLMLGAFAADARAQAWVSPKGEGAVTFAVQNMFYDKHLANTTGITAAGTIDTTSIVADATYGVTDRLSLDFATPYVSSKYTGTRPHPGNLDNGHYHSTFADLRFALRYNVMRRGLVLTPYIGTVTPSHDYVFFAHSAAGERLREFQIGTYAATLLERGIPGLFISGRYSYGFVEKVMDISHNRSTADLEVGYFISRSLRVFGMTTGQITHGGVDLPLGGPPALPTSYQPVHDVIQRVNFLKAGAGASYALTDTIDVFGSFAKQVEGRNGHHLGRAFTVGASFGFSTRWAHPRRDLTSSSMRSAAPVASRQEGSLVRCICQRSR